MSIAELPTPSKKELIRSELEAIWSELGRLTPIDVVDRARPADNPLHAFFEWDDASAAEAYRVVQARGLIQSVHLNIVHGQPSGVVEEYRIRAWLPVRAAGEATAPRGYMPEHEVRANPQLQTIMLQMMQREVQRLHRKYRHMAEFWAELDRLAQEEAATG